MRLTMGERIFQCILVTIISLLCMITIYPFLHIASLSLSSPSEASRFGFHFYPRELDFFAWSQVLSQSKIWTGFGNSVFRTVVGTTLSLIAMSMCAYPLSRIFAPPQLLYHVYSVYDVLRRGNHSYLLIDEVAAFA